MAEQDAPPAEDAPSEACTDDLLAALQVSDAPEEGPEDPRRRRRRERREARRAERARVRAACEDRLEEYDKRCADFDEVQREWKEADDAFKEQLRRIAQETRIYEEALLERQKEQEQAQAQQQTNNMSSGGNPWTSLLYVPVLRPHPPADLRRMRIRLFRSQVNKIVVGPQAQLGRVLKVLGEYAQDLGTDHFLSEDGFKEAMGKEFYSELSDGEVTQLFWRLGGEMRPAVTDGFLPLAGLSDCLVRLLNSGNRLVRTLCAWQRLCSQQELMKHKVRKKKGSKASNLPVDVPESLPRQSIEAVAEGDYVGKGGEPHPSHAALAAAVLALSGNDALPFRDGVLTISDFIMSLRDSPALYTIFFGPMLDAYMRRECSPGAEGADDLHGDD